MQTLIEDIRKISDESCAAEAKECGYGKLSISTIMGLSLITEANLNRILAHGSDGLIIISANRSKIKSNNPHSDLSGEYQHYLEREHKVDTPQNADQWLALRNKKCDKELKQDLIASEYSYTPVFGGYHGKDYVQDSFEPSFIVYNRNRGKVKQEKDFEYLEFFGLELAKKYKQECVYVQAPGKPPVWESPYNGIISNSSSLNTKLNRDNEEYYTTTKRDKTHPEKFTADINEEVNIAYYQGAEYVDRIRRTQRGELFIDIG